MDEHGVYAGTGKTFPRRLGIAELSDNAPSEPKARAPYGLVPMDRAKVPDDVLDPYMGSGTTGHRLHQHRPEILGCERGPEALRHGLRATGSRAKAGLLILTHNKKLANAIIAD